MNNRIEDIKERYWRGETTIDEERRLKQYMSSHNEEDEITSTFFKYVDGERSKTMARQMKKPQRKIVFFRSLMAIAATLLFVIAAYFAMPSFTQKSNHIVVTDTQMALEITREALSLIGGKMEKGEEAVKHSISQLDKTYIYKIL